jgi:hypothetical protein
MEYGCNMPPLKDIRQMALCKTFGANVHREQFAERQQVRRFEGLRIRLIAFRFFAPTRPIERNDDVLPVQHLDEFLYLRAEREVGR